MKVPTKDELRAQVAALTRENNKLQEQLEAEERKRWQERKDDAFEAFYDAVPFMKHEICIVTLEHIDKAGYWFTFELRTDNRKQTYCVRHADIEEETNNE